MTPPLRPPAGQISATIPDAAGFSTVSATQGTVQPDWIVVIKNQTTGALTAVLPEADGSFSVRVPAAASDKLVLLLQDTAGNQTEAPLSRFRNPDGSVAVGTDGGVVEGPEGVSIEIPAGALPPGTVIKVDKATPVDFPQPAPAGFPFMGGLKVAMSASAQQPLELSIPAPPGARPDDQVIVAKYVSWPKGQGWMMMDQAFLENGNYTTNPSAVATHRPPGVAKLLLQALPPPIPTPGLLDPGEFAFLRVNGDCVSYVSVQVGLQTEVAMYLANSPFVFLQNTVLRTMAAVFPWACNTPLTIELRDPNTDELIQRVNQIAPPTRGANVKAFTTDVKAPPRIIQHNLYSGFLQDQLRIHFSKQMISDTVTGGLQVTDQFGEMIAGIAAMEEDASLLVFTPTVPFQMGIQVAVEINGAKDVLAQKELQLAEPLHFTPFAPNQWVELDEQVGAAPGAQAVAAIRDRVFAAHATLDSPIQVLTVVDVSTVTATAALSDTDGSGKPMVVGVSATGLYRLRAMTAIPDVFASLKPGALEAIPLFTPTLTASDVTSIALALNQGKVIPALIDLFATFDAEPNADGSVKTLAQQTRLTRKAMVTVKTAGAAWFIENRSNVYLVEKVDAETLRILVGRDLLAILGTTEPLEGGLELLELWDVTACTKPYALGTEALASTNCVDPVAMNFSRKVLADPKNVVGRFVPNNDKLLRELGVPTQLAVLHDRTADVAVVYVVVAGIGLLAVDVAKAANMPNPLFTDPAPTGLRRGRFTDVAVLKNLVLATESKGKAHEPRQQLLTILTGKLTDFLKPLDGEMQPLEPVLFGNVLAVAAAPNVAYDMDGDGNLGAAENVDADGLPPTGTAAIDEFYDLAFVATGPIPGGQSALWVVDLNAYTDLGENRFSKETSGPRVVAGIPLPISARSVQFDPTRKFAYVEVSGEGLYVIDLRSLATDLRAVQPLDGAQAPEPRDENEDGRDDRIVGIYSLPGIGNRAEIAVSFDPKRPIGYLHDFNAGVELVQVCNTCQELLLDFNEKDTFVDQAKAPAAASQSGQTTDGSKENDKTDALRAEKRILLSLLEGAAVSVTQLVPGLGPNDFYMLEQGSGGCFWTQQFDSNPTAACKSFNPGSSDHDFEVFFPAYYIRRAQDVLDDFVRNPPPEKAAQLKKLEISPSMPCPRTFRVGPAAELAAHEQGRGHGWRPGHGPADAAAALAADCRRLCPIAGLPGVAAGA